MNFNKILAPAAIVIFTIGAWQAFQWAGIALAAGGVKLVSLGGSWYFLVGGLVMAVSGLLIARFKTAGAWLFAAFCAWDTRSRERDSSAANPPLPPPADVIGPADRPWDSRAPARTVATAARVFEAALADFPLVLPGAHNPIRALVDAVLLPRRITLNVVAEVGDQLTVMSDLCLDEFTDHGHCGVLCDHGVDNDATLLNLGKQAVVAAAAGRPLR